MRRAPYHLVRATLLSLLFLICSPASAKVFKCVDDRGKTLFSDRPCSPNNTEKVVEHRASGSGGSRANQSADKRSGLGTFVDRAGKQVNSKPSDKRDKQVP